LRLAAGENQPLKDSSKTIKRGPSPSMGASAGARIVTIPPTSAEADNRFDAVTAPVSP
jgi:hypothetical protein